MDLRPKKAEERGHEWEGGGVGIEHFVHFDGHSGRMNSAGSCHRTMVRQLGRMIDPPFQQRQGAAHDSGAANPQDSTATLQHRHTVACCGAQEADRSHPTTANPTHLSGGGSSLMTRSRGEMKVSAHTLPPPADSSVTLALPVRLLGPPIPLTPPVLLMYGRTRTSTGTRSCCDSSSRDRPRRSSPIRTPCT